MPTRVYRIRVRRATAPPRRPGWLTRRGRAAQARFNRQPQALMLLEIAAVIGLLALLYLSQVATLTTTHQTLLSEQARQTELRRQDAEVHAQLGYLQSPAYVEQRAL